jgi:hypothetical protein
LLLGPRYWVLVLGLLVLGVPAPGVLVLGVAGTGSPGSLIRNLWLRVLRVFHVWEGVRALSEDILLSVCDFWGVKAVRLA